MSGKNPNSVCHQWVHDDKNDWVPEDGALGVEKGDDGQRVRD